MTRWSKLQKLVYGIVDPDIGFQIHCRVYRMNSQGGHTGIPRYWISLGKDILWDYPQHFVADGLLNRHAAYTWPYATDISAISDLIREYIDTPRDAILSAEFPQDVWGLADVLRAADRRIGRRSWDAIPRRKSADAVEKILARRGAFIARF